MKAESRKLKAEGEGSTVAGVADPGRGAERITERLTERIFVRGRRPYTNQGIRNRHLRDVA